MSAQQPSSLAVSPSRSFPAFAFRFTRLTEGAVLFAVALAVYLSTAIIIVLQMHLIVGDALSRVGNAYYVLFSRDPHLAAIGFVWNPLPSLLVMPLLPFRVIWPALAADGFAGCIVSALAMSAAVYQFRGSMADWGIPRVTGVILTLLFALHPMAIQYGANGDSEALFLLFLIVTARYLSRWLESRSIGALVVAAIALALAYLTRYEAAAVAAGVSALVASISYVRARGFRASRLREAAADALIVASPFALTFILWAFASWVIVGNPFEQFSSVYGTASQLQAGSVVTDLPLSRSALVMGQILGLEPFLLALVVAAVARAIATKDIRVVAPLVVIGAALLFAAVAWWTGRTGGWLRYYITAVPLAFLMVAFVAARLPNRSQWVVPWARRPALHPTIRGLGMAVAGFVTVIVIAAASVSIPSSVRTMTNPVLGREDHYKAYDYPRYLLAKQVSGYLDGKNLRDGAVLIDSFLGFPIILSSNRPRQFVITADRDFPAVVADPVTFNVRYILVPPGGGLSALDAIERRWPAIYQTGAGIASLEKEFDVPGGGDNFRWRLYRLTG